MIKCSAPPEEKGKKDSPKGSRLRGQSDPGKIIEFDHVIIEKSITFAPPTRLATYNPSYQRHGMRKTEGGKYHIFFTCIFNFGGVRRTNYQNLLYKTPSHSWKSRLEIPIESTGCPCRTLLPTPLPDDDLVNGDDCPRPRVVHSSYICSMSLPSSSPPSRTQ